MLAVQSFGLIGVSTAVATGRSLLCQYEMCLSLFVHAIAAPSTAIATPPVSQPKEKQHSAYCDLASVRKGAIQSARIWKCRPAPHSPGRRVPSMPFGLSPKLRPMLSLDADDNQVPR